MGLPHALPSLLLHWHESLSFVLFPNKEGMFMNGDITTRGLPLGEAFSHHLRAFWNPVAACELSSSPDGTQLAVICSDGSVRVIDAQTGNEHYRFIGSRRRIGPLIVDDPLPAKCAAWSPDGLCLAVGYEDGSIRIWDLAFQDEQLCWEWHTDRVTYLAWSPDGQAVASIENDATLGVWEAATGEARFIYQGPEERIKPPQFIYPYYCSWSPSSEYLAVACSDSTIRVLTAENGEEEALLHCERTAEVVSWSPVGACILVLFNQEAAVWNPFENHFQSLMHSEIPLQLAAWSPDGVHIALGSEEWVGMWKWEDLYEGRLDQGLAYYGKDIHSASWLPDHMLALAGAQGIMLVPVGTQRNEKAMPKPDDLFALLYDPNDGSSRKRAHSHYLIVTAAKAYGDASPGSILAKTCEHVLAHVGRYGGFGAGELDVLYHTRKRELEHARLDPACEQARLLDLQECVRFMETIQRIQRTPLEQLPVL
jgi:WD40 repeat protein